MAYFKNQLGTPQFSQYEQYPQFLSYLVCLTIMLLLSLNQVRPLSDSGKGRGTHSYIIIQFISQLLV